LGSYEERRLPRPPRGALPEISSQALNSGAPSPVFMTYFKLLSVQSSPSALRPGLGRDPPVSQASPEKAQIQICPLLQAPTTDLPGVQEKTRCPPPALRRKPSLPGPTLQPLTCPESADQTECSQ
jgi:hypothetical protein